jgi:hypothetical protein
VNVTGQTSSVDPLAIFGENREQADSHLIKSVQVEKVESGITL